MAVLNGLSIYHHRLKKSTFERTHTGIIIPFSSHACYINDMAVFSFIPMKRICQWLTYKTSRFAIIHEFTCFCAFIMLECASKNFSITHTFYIWMEKKFLWSYSFIRPYIVIALRFRWFRIHDIKLYPLAYIAVTFYSKSLFAAFIFHEAEDCFKTMNHYVTHTINGHLNNAWAYMVAVCQHSIDYTIINAVGRQR